MDRGGKQQYDRERRKIKLITGACGKTVKRQDKGEQEGFLHRKDRGLCIVNPAGKGIGGKSFGQCFFLSASAAAPEGQGIIALIKRKIRKERRRTAFSGKCTERKTEKKTERVNMRPETRARISFEGAGILTPELP